MMANPSTIRQRLAPWIGRNGLVRYYVRDVDKLIGDSLWREGERVGHYNFLNDAKMAKVWFDDSGKVHVENVSDPLASEAIAKLIDAHFSTSPVLVPEDSVVLDWSEATDSLPHDMKDQTYHFEYKGRVYLVNVTVYCWERDHNPATRGPDGSISFQSDSSDLWELVVELIRDGMVKPKGMSDEIFISLSSNVDTISSMSGSESDRPKYSSTKKREPEPQERPAPKPEPRLVLHRLTDEEIERMSRESAMETRHPKSRWSKAEVIEVCERAGMPRESISALKRMKLEDIRSTLLLYDGTDITGNDYIDYQQRHTRFYRLDFDLIRMLGDDDRVMRDRSWHDRESLLGKVWGVTPRLQAGGTVSR